MKGYLVKVRVSRCGWGLVGLEGAGGCEEAGLAHSEGLGVSAGNFCVVGGALWHGWITLLDRAGAWQGQLVWAGWDNRALY